MKPQQQLIIQGISTPQDLAELLAGQLQSVQLSSKPGHLRKIPPLPRKLAAEYCEISPSTFDNWRNKYPLVLRPTKDNRFSIEKLDEVLKLEKRV